MKKMIIFVEEQDVFTNYKCKEVENEKIGFQSSRHSRQHGDFA
jgi:hypothetical protein